jgi:hypothetical protein
MKYAAVKMSESSQPAHVDVRSFCPAVQFVDARDLAPNTAALEIRGGAMMVSAYRLEQFLNASNPSCSG